MYFNTYGKLVETDKKQLMRNVTEFVKHWACQEIPVVDRSLRREERREKMMGMSRT